MTEVRSGLLKQVLARTRHFPFLDTLKLNIAPPHYCYWQDLYELPSIRTLIIRGGDWTGKKTTGRQVPGLEELEIAVRDPGKLESLFSVLEEFPTLKRLSLDVMPEALESGKGRDLKGQFLQSISGLEALRIEGLRHVGQGIGKLIQLKSLEIVDCEGLAGLRGIGKLPHLEKLVLRGLHLQSAYLDTARLPALQYLDLSGNDFGYLTFSADTAPALKVLKMRGNQLRDLPKGISELKSLEELDLSRNQLQSCTASLAHLKKLERVDLSANQLNKVPEGLESIPELKSLGLAGNKLLAWPEKLAELGALEALDMRRTGIRALHPALIGLPKLRSLRIDQEKLENATGVRKGRRINSFFRKRMFWKLEPEKQIIALELLCEMPPEKGKKLSRHVLFEALNWPMGQIRLEAEHLLYQHKGPDPGTRPASVRLAGKFRHMWESKLEGLGIRVIRQAGQKAEWVVLGAFHRQATVKLARGGKTLLTESQLQALYWQWEPSPFQSPGYEKQRANLLRLLRGGAQSQILLALRSMEKAGVPEQAFAWVAGLHFLHEAEEIRILAGEVLFRHLPFPTQLIFLRHYRPSRELRVRRQLQYLFWEVSRQAAVDQTVLRSVLSDFGPDHLKSRSYRF